MLKYIPNRLKDACIAEDVLKDFLMKHREEAKAMSIFEYDQEKHIRQEREEAWEEGRASGLQEGRASGLKEGRASGLKEGQASGLKLAETIFRLFREGKTIEEISAECNLPEEQIRELLGQKE